MYKKILAFVALAAGLLLLQCSDKPTQPEQKIKLGELFTLTPGKTLEVQGEDLSLTFRSVLSDSRCPFGVECFWQGMAEIEIKLRSKAGDTTLVTLGVLGGTRDNAENPYSVDTIGYRLSFLRLEPYPESMVLSRLMTPPQPLSGYQATLRIDHTPVVDSLDGSVMITNLPPDSILLDYFAIDSVSIVGDSLNVAVNYGGCCKNHYFFLFMSPASFFESSPAQAELYLRHFANNDLCKCIAYRSLRFDLKPIADLYLQVYGVAEPIALNISEFTNSIPDKSFRVIYYPTGAQHNRAPVLSQIGPQTVKEDDTLRFAVSAVDPDGTIPTLSAINLPSHASFIDNVNGTGMFLFVPDMSQAGDYQITFIASDGELADSEVVEITVTESIIEVLMLMNIFGSRTVVVGGTLVLAVSVYGSEDAIPIVTAFGIPENAVLTQDNPTRYTFTFTPDSSQVGDHDILFVASDGNLADSEMVTIRVGDTGSLIPTAVGNNWRYEIISIDSAGGIAAFIDEVRITGSLMDASGHDIWWSLSSPIPPITDRFMVRNDSVYSGSGLEFLRTSDGPLEYFVSSTPDIPGFELLSGTPRVVSRLDSVIILAGIFKNCYRYERRACDTSSAGISCYDETYIIAPGVGILGIGFEKSVIRPEYSYEVRLHWRLSIYTLEQP
jgi:hypothetical protein